MALIACPDCKAEVSDKASACPKCGHPIAAPVLEQTTRPKTIQATCPYCNHNNVMPEPWPHPGFNCGSCGKGVRFETPPNGASPPTAPQLIEQTGKQYKGLQVLGCLGIFIGFILVCAGLKAGPGDNQASIGFLVILGGLILWFGGAVGGWWNHG